MKKLMTLCIVLTAVAFLAAPAFAEVQNVKVSGDIDSKMIYQADYDLLANDTASGKSTKDNDVWFMTTTRIRVDADLTDNVSTTVRIVNERDWNLENSDGNTTDMDLDLAYVTLKECFYSPLTVTIGRQNLVFGNALVVGDPYTNDTESAAARISADDLSVMKAFDAMRATLDYSPVVVDLIYAKIDPKTLYTGATFGTADLRDDIDLWGINAAYDFDNEYNAAIEGYIFSRRDRSQILATAAQGNADTCNVWGINGSMEPISGLLLSGEAAIQTGDYNNTEASPDKAIDRDAWALDLAVVYDGLSDSVGFLPGLSLRTAYVYRSGQTHDDASTDTDFSTTTAECNAWDPMYEDQTHGMIANWLFDGINDGVDSNGRTICVGASAEPIEDLTLSIDYYNFRLAEAWYSDNTAGQFRTLQDNRYYVRDDKDLGYEVDVILDYAYTEDVTMSLASGWFCPGDAFNNNKSSGIPDNNDTAKEVIASIAVAF